MRSVLQPDSPSEYPQAPVALTGKAESDADSRKLFCGQSLATIEDTYIPHYPRVLTFCITRFYSLVYNVIVACESTKFLLVNLALHASKLDTCTHRIALADTIIQRPG